MISSVTLNSKPVIATAKPVNELSSEMTTGMSAPPIGSTNSTPNISAAGEQRRRTRTRHASDVAMMTTARAQPTTSATSALTNLLPG